MISLQSYRGESGLPHKKIREGFFLKDVAFELVLEERWDLALRELGKKWDANLDHGLFDSMCSLEEDTAMSY